MGTLGAWNVDFPDCFDHRRQWATAAINAERHQTVFVSSIRLVSESCIPASQVIDECVAKAVNRLSGAVMLSFVLYRPGSSMARDPAFREQSPVLGLGGPNQCHSSTADTGSALDQFRGTKHEKPAFASRSFPQLSVVPRLRPHPLEGL